MALGCGATRSLEFRQRIVSAAYPNEGQSEIVVCAGEFWIQGNGLTQIHLSLFNALLQVVAVANITEDIGFTWHSSQGFAIPLLRHLEVSFAIAQHTQPPTSLRPRR